MTASIAQTDPKKIASKKKIQKISIEEFLRLYSDIEDGYKYEFNDGFVEKYAPMNQEQLSIQNILFRAFVETVTFKKGGILTPETDMKTLKNQLRRPNLAIYSGEQIQNMKKGNNEVANWVAEVISENDQINPVNDKIEEYFKAGVKVVWIIFPKHEKVDVYTSPDDVFICRDKKICSAAPAFPDFEIAAREIFA